MTKTLTVNFTPTGTGTQTYTVRYRIIGGSTYTTVPSTTAAPVVISGVASGVDFEGFISTACASGGTAPDVPFTSYVGTGAVTAANNLSGSSLDLISKSTSTPFVAIATGSLPLTLGQSLTGNYTSYSGLISLSVSGTFTAGYGNLRRNGGFLQSVAIPTAGVYSLSGTFNGIDDLTITLDAAIGT